MTAIEEWHTVRIAKALAEPTRFVIYRRIMEFGEMRCGEIGVEITVQAPTVSHHLKVLSDAGLIEARRDGRGVYYRALPRALNNYLHLLRKLEQTSHDSNTASDPCGDGLTVRPARIRQQG